MKKLLLITTLVTSLSTSAFAKTEGNHLGINVSRVFAKHKYQSALGDTASNYRAFDDSAIGYGVNYKYAFNFDGIFVAPEIFADQLGTKAQDQDGDNISLNHRYGAKLNAGYDVTDEVAIYTGVGAAMLDYKVDWKSVSLQKRANKTALIVAAGISYNLNKNVILNLEYNFQNIDLSTPHIGYGGISRADTDLSALKFGVAYRF